MSLTDDLRAFSVVHRGHGTVTYTASVATESGYDQGTTSKVVKIQVRPDPLAR